ncbi:MAG TPA: hypothetical protein VIR55_08715 [Ignavibacteria bacterium]
MQEKILVSYKKLDEIKKILKDRRKYHLYFFILFLVVDVFLIILFNVYKNEKPPIINVPPLTETTNSINPDSFKQHSRNTVIQIVENLNDNKEEKQDNKNKEEKQDNKNKEEILKKIYTLTFNDFEEYKRNKEAYKSKESFEFNFKNSLEGITIKEDETNKKTIFINNTIYELLKNGKKIIFEEKDNNTFKIKISD